MNFEGGELEFLKHMFREYGLKSIEVSNGEYFLSDESIWWEISNLSNPDKNTQDHIQLMKLIENLIYIESLVGKIKVQISEKGIFTEAA